MDQDTPKPLQDLYDEALEDDEEETLPILSNPEFIEKAFQLPLDTIAFIGERWLTGLQVEEPLPDPDLEIKEFPIPAWVETCPEALPAWSELAHILPNVESLEIGPEHLPELVRLATDPMFSRYEDDGRWYLRRGAVEALTALQLPAAIEPLLKVIVTAELEIGDYDFEDFPRYLAALGPGCLEPVLAELERAKTSDSPDHEDDYHRIAILLIETLRHLGRLYPSTAKTQVVPAVAELLRDYAEQDISINAKLIGILMDHRAIEHSDLIKAAFEAEAVDEFYNGDLEDVFIEMGLLNKRTKPRRRSVIHDAADLLAELHEPQPRFGGALSQKSEQAKKDQKKKLKDKKKAQRKARKKKR